MIQAFIFDLDGVLVDTAKYHFRAWHRLAKSIDIHFTEEENEQLKGVSRKESLEKIMQWGGVSLPEKEKEKLMALKNAWYLEFVNEMDASETLPGVRLFLEECRAMQLKIALGSASKNAVQILQRTELSSFFDVVIDGTKTSKSKPHPQVFLMGAEALDVQPAKSVVFEDSIAGIEAAQRGGFKSVGIGKAQNLGKADLILESLQRKKASEIINHLNF